MAQESRGSNALGWVVLGFLAGVAATLGVMTFMSPGHRHHEEPAEVSAPIAPAAPKVAQSAAKPVAKTAQTTSSAAAAATTTDQQVQEDAAAAGMTSRRQSSEPPAPN